jgi:hypothetical protein
MIPAKKLVEAMALVEAIRVLTEHDAYHAPAHTLNVLAAMALERMATVLETV